MISILLMVGIVIGCNSSQEILPNDLVEAAIADTLLSITEAYNAAWEKLDLDQISEYHADDFTYYRRGTLDSKSQSEFEQVYHDDVATQITSYWADASNIWVEVLGTDAGTVAFEFRGGVTTPDGATHDYDGALTYIFERRDGHWRLVHIHESAYRPQAP